MIRLLYINLVPVNKQTEIYNKITSEYAVIKKKNILITLLLL